MEWNILSLYTFYRFCVITSQKTVFFFNLFLWRKSVFESESSLFMRLALYAWHYQPRARAAFPREEEIPVFIG